LAPGAAAAAKASRTEDLLLSRSSRLARRPGEQTVMGLSVMNDKAIDPVHDEILSNEVSDDALEAAADNAWGPQQMSLMVSGPVGYPDFCC